MVYLKIYKQIDKRELIIGHYSAGCKTEVSKNYANECKYNFRYEVTYNDDDFMLVKLFVEQVNCQQQKIKS